MLQPVLIEDVPREMPDNNAGVALGPMLRVIAEGNGTAIISICRPGDAVTDVDRRWHQLILEGCRAAGVRLIGFYVATPSCVISLPDPLSAAG